MSQLSPSVVLLLEQLTASVSGPSALERLHVVFKGLKELLACAILSPTTLHHPPSSSPVASTVLPQPPHPSPPPLALSDSPVKRAAPTSSPPATASRPRPPPPPSSSPLSQSVDGSRASSAATSHPDWSASPHSVSAADVRLMSELLHLCYIDALARPLSAATRGSTDDNDDLSVPPSAASLSLIAFLTSQPHFASTSSFRALLSQFVSQCGVLFLLHVADRLHCLPRALSFIACHALPHVHTGCIAFIVARQQCAALLTVAAGAHILRQLPANQQLEILIMHIIAPHTHTLSALTVMSQLWDLIPALDSHSLYRLATLLDPVSNTVSPATVDSHSRIVMCELFLHALCRIRYKAEQSRSERPNPQQSDKQQQLTGEAGEESADADVEDEELTFYSSDSLHAALVRHRHSYRVWLLLAVLHDLRLYEAAAIVYETAEQWVDAVEARLRHITALYRRTRDSNQQHADDARKRTGAAIEGLLHSHVAQVAAGPEQARTLALLIRAWRECDLPAEELQAQLVQHVNTLADSLSILAFAAHPPPAVEVSPPVASPASHLPLSFSPFVLLHLTRYRLELLQQSRTAAASVSLGSHTASPRVWHDIRQRLHGKVGRRQMAEVGGVSEMTQLTDYTRDPVHVFTCGHSQYAFDLAEVSVTHMLNSTSTQRPSQQQQQQHVTAAVTRQYERVQRDGGVVRLACPTCVTVALSGQQRQQPQQWTSRTKLASPQFAGNETASGST